MSVRKYWFKAPTDYTDTLKRTGHRSKARAFWEYCDDIDNDEHNSTSFYAKSWGLKAKSTAHVWVKEFKYELERFKAFWELTNSQVQEPIERLSNDNRTITEPKKTIESTTPLDVQENISYNNKTNSERLSNEGIRTKSKNKRKKNTPISPLIVLPQCIAQVDWDKWIAYRIERNITINTMTLNAQVNQLSQWFNKGYIPSEIIDASISNGWQGLFAPRKKPSTSHASLVVGNNVHIAPWVQANRDKRNNGEAIMLQLNDKGYDNIFDYLQTV